jgi:hypothetical protein
MRHGLGEGHIQGRNEDGHGDRLEPGRTEGLRVETPENELCGNKNRESKCEANNEWQLRSLAIGVEGEGKKKELHDVFSHGYVM